ncbi:hypothetical protein C8R44DRAFT_881619 [Mycena epipterygia]|nr:hypothetical protein C8R44DRAFT_881619 [Mycena epipterygia]
MSSPHFDTTLGTLQIGVLVSCVLFGVTTTQSYIYHARFPKDSRKMKTLVACVWFCELGHIVCIAHTLYVMTISNFAHPERLGDIPQTLGVSTLFNAVVAVCVQGFFSFRIYRLSKTLYIPFLTCTLAFFYFAGTVVLFVFGQTTPFTSVEVQWGWLLKSIWSVAAANDVILAATQVFWLWRRRDNSHHITAILIDKLIAWSIGALLPQTSSATVAYLSFRNRGPYEARFSSFKSYPVLDARPLISAAAILNLACFVTMTDNFIWIACLNSRTTLRTMNTHTHPPISASYPVSLSHSMGIEMSEIQSYSVEMGPTSFTAPPRHAFWNSSGSEK